MKLTIDTNSNEFVVSFSLLLTKSLLLLLVLFAFMSLYSLAFNVRFSLLVVVVKIAIDIKNIVLIRSHLYFLYNSIFLSSHRTRTRKKSTHTKKKKSLEI